MDQIGFETDGLVRRAEHIASLYDQLSDRRWITDLLTVLRRSERPLAAELLMVELTLSDVERSAQKLLDLRDNLVHEVEVISDLAEVTPIRSESA